VRYRPVDASAGHGTRLFGETVFPVCSPRLRKAPFPKLAAPADLGAHTLLRMEPDGGNQLQDWGLWLHAMHLDDLRPAGVLQFSSYDQLISAAVAGQGVALGRVPLITNELKARRLVAPFSDRVVSPRGYFVVVSKASADKPEVHDFTTWLAASAREPAPARGPGSGRRPGRTPP